MSLLLVIVLVINSGCQATPPTTEAQHPVITTAGDEVQNIQVNKVSPQRTSGATEEFPLPNCGGTETLSQTLGTQVSVSKSVQMGTTASVSGSGEVGVSAAAKVTVQAAIEAAYQQEYETANSRLDTIGMGAAPKTHVVYTIEWEKQEFSSVVAFEFNRELVQTPYTFIMNVPKIANSREEQCPNAGGDTQLPTDTPQPPAIPTDTPTAVVINTDPNATLSVGETWHTNGLDVMLREASFRFSDELDLYFVFSNNTGKTLFFHFDEEMHVTLTDNNGKIYTWRYHYDQDVVLENGDTYTEQVYKGGDFSGAQYFIVELNIPEIITAKWRYN